MPDPIERILTFLSSHSGQDFFSYSRPLVERRVAERLSQLGHVDAAGYCEQLISDEGEAGVLARMLLVRYSRFFRHPLQFHLLRDVLLPPCLVESDAGMYKVWSAASAAGEEAFSLAIILDEAARSAERCRPVTIFATDIAEDALQEGRRAHYPAVRLEEVSLGRLKTYFIADDGGYRVCDELRRMVSFSRHNMLDRRTFAPPESIFGGFDLILCRNFMMYLSEEAYGPVFDKLFRALKPEGILMLGRAETVPEAYRSVMDRLYDFGGLYRKITKR